jgi:hypothetical protein
MPLRIGFDVDGVLADFGAAFRDVETRLFGAGPGMMTPRPEKEDPRQSNRKPDVIWQDIQATADFWRTLKPIDEDAVRRIHEMTIRHGWEVFFITKRPKTKGQSVQRQTQQWLVEHGFDLPSVLVLGGSRGAAAKALRLDYHVDDSPQNCLDVKADSNANPILIVPESDETVIASSRTLGIGTAASVGECLDILETASAARDNPGLLARLAAMVGWK